MPAAFPALAALPDPLPIDPLPVGEPGRPLRGRLRPPGSKSLTNRALIVAALADGQSHLSGVLDSDDTRVMVAALNALGIPVDHDRAAATARVRGCGGRVPADRAELDCHNSGTSLRFLSALCALGTGTPGTGTPGTGTPGTGTPGTGTYRLDGDDRMRERPVADLADALAALGAGVTCERGTGCPPLSVRGTGRFAGEAAVAGGKSSQFLSALLMAAPCGSGPVTLRVDPGPLVSVPYVTMTRRVMAAFGVEVPADGPADAPVFRVTPARYRAAEYAVEPDASAASYLFAAAAITGGEVTVEGLGADSVQGDLAFLDVLERMGCAVETAADSVTVRGPAGDGERRGRLRGGDFDFNAISDTAQTAAAVAVFADGPTTVRNIAHARHKETDRVSAIALELRQLGQTVEEFPDGFTVHPAPVTPAVVETYNDHRMAMSFALVGLRAAGVRIANPACVAKTYPGFWEDFAALRGR